MKPVAPVTDIEAPKVRQLMDTLHELLDAMEPLYPPKARLTVVRDQAAPERPLADVIPIRRDR